MKQILRHLVSAVSLSVITLNLLFWIPPLVLIATLQWLLPPGPWKFLLQRLIAWIYKAAVHVNTWWLTSVLGLDLVIHGQPPTEPRQRLLVVANHQSWYDILILQALISRRGPMLKFLIKRELVFVPVVGWICLALGFPRLLRGQSEDGRAQDYQAVASASIALGDAPGALMNFVEGTRYTEEKHERQRFVFKHLLQPKVGGFKIMLEHLPGVDILDVTLVYPEAGLSFWSALDGHLGQVHVYLRFDHSGDIQDPKSWLEARWRDKDAVIGSHRISRTGTTHSG